MIIHKSFQLPKDKERLLKKAVLYEYLSVLTLIVTAVIMYLVMGSSQTMKTSWVEDVISLIPPILFLISVRFRNKLPSKTFPYGHRRIMIIAFFGASLSLLLFGGFLLIDALTKLFLQEHPTIGLMKIRDFHFWQGWAMMAALALSMVPVMVLGRLKTRIAKELHEKTLFTDGRMNRADWMTALSGIVGIWGVGLGFWWADALAAILISSDITLDGLRNVRDSVSDLMDRRPMKVDRSGPLEVEEKIKFALENLDWVKRAEVRLREDGQVLIGEVFLVPLVSDWHILPMEEALSTAKTVDWRIHDLVFQIQPNFRVFKDDWYVEETPIVH